MVARDGIEPPTPAFSGPRSTTELPGQIETIESAQLPAVPFRIVRIGWRCRLPCAQTTKPSIPIRHVAAKRAQQRVGLKSFWKRTAFFNRAMRGVNVDGFKATEGSSLSK
jgi:hypothetical protein